MELFIVMLMNGLVTAGFSPFLLKIYRRNKKRFYLYWGAGFLLYGINIILRAFSIINVNESLAPAIWVVVFASYMSGFTLIITGNGSLMGMAKVWLASSVSIFLIPVTVYLLSGPESVGWVASLTPYFLTSLSMFFIRRRYHVSLDLFIMGWLTLLLVNLAMPLSLIRSEYIEVLAIFAKTIIFVGMVSPRFSFLEDDVRRFLISGLPKEYPSEENGRFFLINPGEGNRNDEVKWIKEKVAGNSENGIKTILISFYDLISVSALGSVGLGKDLYLVRMQAGGNHNVQVFKDSTTTMTDDLSQFNFFLSDMFAYSTERNIRCDVILYTLSWIIHSNGWKRVYSQFLSMSPGLKASQVNMYCFYYPETHGDRAEVSVFEKLADRIILI
jgi:hypothetical protein